MSLSHDLVSQFVKITNDNKKIDTKKETITYGVVMGFSGEDVLVKLDGTSASVTDYLPATTSVSVTKDDRVIVMIKNHSAVITGNLGNPATTTGYVDSATSEIKETANNAKNEAIKATNKIVEYDTVIANIRVDTDELTAEIARIKNLETDSLLTDTVKANAGDIDTLKSDNVTISGKVEAAEGNITDLQTETASISERLETAEAIISGSLTADEIEARFATISELETERGRIDALSSDVADIDALTSEFISGETVTSEFSNSVVSQIGDAQIESAMIKNIDAGKIQSGSIDTNKVNIQSEDGSFVIAENRLQIKEGDTVRVQIGKDGTGNYSVSICDADGNVIFSEDGITDDGIPDNIIVNDMVSETADIHASKLDIDSLFEEINGSTNTIKSTQITVDDEGQTLEAKLTTLATTESVEGLSETVTSQGTQITANTEAIESKIWTQDIETAKTEIGETTTDLSTKYSELEQTVSGISTTVASHSTEITNKADSSTVTEISSKVTEIETDIDGFKTTVSETYAAKSDLDNYSTTDSVEVAKDRINTVDEKVTVNTSLIEQLSDSISMLVTDANGASLMTQTETGWTFSTGNIETLANKTSEDLAALTDSLGSTDHTVSVLEQAVADLGELADYIKITTYEDEPCIELGEGDSEFKLRITNTQMIFTEGSNILAYFNNQALHIKKAVVEEELQQGEYVWITRSNGHLSLIWKGGSN